MKNLILIFTLISGFAFGQFTIKESSDDWQLIGKPFAALKLLKKDNKAKLVYIDYETAANKTNIFSPSTEYTFEFSIDDQTLDNLYNLIAEHFKTKKKEEITLEFPEGKMYLLFYNFFGYGVQFKFDAESNLVDKNSSYKRSTFGLDLKSVNLLFGKKK